MESADKEGLSDLENLEIMKIQCKQYSSKLPITT